MEMSLISRRIAYRIAHRVLRAYWFVRRPELRGVKCVLTDGDDVLLVMHTYGRREWELPGGGVKRDEPPAAAAQREMHEELGVRIDDWRALGELSARPYRSRDRLHCFHAELSSRELEIDRGELRAARWFSRRELPPDLGRYVRAILALVAEPGRTGSAP